MDVEAAVQDLKSQAEANQTTKGVMMLQRQIAIMGFLSVSTKPRNAKLIQQYIRNQTDLLTMAGCDVVS